jgi:antitoxin HicB
LAEPTVSSRSFPDAALTVQITASYARKIFECGLKMSGGRGQAAAISTLMQVVKAKNNSHLIFSRAKSYQKRYISGMKEDKLKRFETKSTEYLREEGVYGDVEASAMKHVIAATLAQRMERLGMSVSELADTLGTSRAAVNRVLDPLNTSLTLVTLARTAAALGCRVKLEIATPR